MSDERITIHVAGAFTLTPEQVYPDGVPEAWTAEDVAALMQKHGCAEVLIRDWNLGRLTVDVAVESPNEAYSGDHVMFGEPPSRVHRKVARVW